MTTVVTNRGATKAIIAGNPTRLAVKRLRRTSVYSADDVDRARVVRYPRLGRRVPMLELGRRAAELAMDLIDDPVARPSRISYAPAVIVRRSTGPATAGLTVPKRGA